MIKIAPSLLSCDLLHIGEELKKMEQSGADYVHIDCFDGHFAPNIAFGPDFVKAIKKGTSLPLDVHLMLENPLRFVSSFLDAGSDFLTFHQEVISQQEFASLSAKLHSRNVKIGLSLMPVTPIEKIKPYLKDCDLVLVMSVMPGFSGQKFQENALQRIADLKKEREEMHASFLIEVDGGVNDTNAFSLIESGADILVSGSYLFEGNMKDKIERVKRYE